MKLNKWHKEAFVTAVMADVPKVDHDEQARKLVNVWEKASIPPAVKKAMEQNPEWFERKNLYTPGRLNSVSAYAKEDGYHIRQEFPELWSQLEELATAKAAQATQLQHLQAKLTSTINGCSTLKQALEILPEFEKYLPSEEAKTASLPMVSGMVAELIAAGWPKAAA
jgi:hypothetical protein